MKREYEGLKLVAEHTTEPYEEGGIQWGGHHVIMEFPKQKRPSKGWRRRVRRIKQEQK